MPAKPSLPGTFAIALFFFWKDNCKMPLLGSVVKKSTCQCKRHRRHEFDPWVRKIPWRRKWQPATLFFAWQIPRTEEPGVPQSRGSQRTAHSWACPHAATIPISEWQRERLRPCPLVYRDSHFKSYNCISCEDVTKIKKIKIKTIIPHSLMYVKKIVSILIS